MKMKMIPMNGKKLDPSVARLADPYPFRYGLPPGFKTKYRRGRLMGAGERNSRGLRHGNWYELREGFVISLTQYCNGVIEGLAQQYDREARLVEVASYKGGKKQTQLTFYRDGRLAKIIEYDKSEYPLSCETFNERGHRHCWETYKDGKIHGIALTYNAEGKRMGKTRHVKGLREGTSISYGVGKSRIISYFKRNRRHGWEMYYNIQGQLERKTRWKNGKTVRNSTKNYDYSK